MKLNQQPGQFDRLIDILKPTELDPVSDSDGAGGWTGDSGFIELATNVWCDIEQLSGKRLLEFGAVKFKAMYEIRVMINPDVKLTEDCILIYNGNRLVIHEKRNEDEDDWMNIVLAYSEK